MPNLAPSPTPITIPPIVFGEGKTGSVIVPYGVYSDSEGDAISIYLALEDDYSAMPGWLVLSSGIEGTASFDYTNVVYQSIGTSEVVMIFVQDPYSVGMLTYNVGVYINRKPVGPASLQMGIYPNDTFSKTYDFGALINDPDSDPFTMSFAGQPGYLTITQISPIVYEFSGVFPLTPSNPVSPYQQMMVFQLNLTSRSICNMNSATQDVRNAMDPLSLNV